MTDSDIGGLIPDQGPQAETGYRFARRFGVVPGHLQDGHLDVYVRADCDPQALLELRRRAGHPLKPHVLDDDAFAARLRDRYERSANDAMQFVEGLSEDADLMSVAQSLSEPEDLLESQDEAPIIRLINALLSEAVKENASDIHIEPFENRLSIRLRVDGVLREILEPPRALAPVIVSRIKVMAKLDIAEKRLPQDGRIGLKLVGRAVDVRVSTLPSGHGERVVLRLLDKQAGRLELRQLGMGKDHYEAMERVIARPHGIVLVTGPTGSGKTTTLYSALMQLNDRSRNILTVEDPIEYYLDGIGQTQINTKVDMTFARGLRAILRQDPDVVMVGEIRDVETVQIAIQASLTGHLVFSTLHTNTAVGAITRLRDMGIEPFLLSSTLNGVLAQRLVRTLCPACRKPHQASASECRLMGISEQQAPTLYSAVGCEECNNNGYKGRTGIYELIEVDDTLRGLIHDGASEQAMIRHARLAQTGIRHDGVRRVLAGQTTLEEVLRVTRED
ncbi:type II secretion system protein GspE [Halopseudomonas laoshanensis]|uniref:Type II secretion system protein E n=1 Tax=Halopseudomonas laoshanensis TaxID=2268758 RepID=A0A7V7GVV5_9GAMM|nr:type II secretion system ATPase GspE [Halopseudomonas laoshanensis]KAA0695929.1 type II secretion system protein GspE [Halopseudomonas laoshanensis]MBQ0741663.1 type II secretion system ATPase GspE [Pseudomonas sp.]WOD10280.1 type II secretion system ATPase GspE [Pseudomonas sp. NyZ704]